MSGSRLLPPIFGLIGVPSPLAPVPVVSLPSWPAPVAAAIIEFDHRAQRRLAAIVEVGGGQGNVAQGRHLEGTVDRHAPDAGVKATCRSWSTTLTPCLNAA